MPETTHTPINNRTEKLIVVYKLETYNAVIVNEPYKPEFSGQYYAKPKASN